MTSSTDVEIGDEIWITDPQHPHYGKTGKVITKTTHSGRGRIGVRLNGSTIPVGIFVKDGGFVMVTYHKDWHQKPVAEEEHFPSSLSDRDKGILAKLQDGYGIHDALGATSGDGRCSDCEMYEAHGIHWDSCGNRGKIHMGWCSIEAWEAFRKDWFEEFGEQADFKQEARQRVSEAIQKGGVFQVEILEGHPSMRKPTEDQMDKIREHVKIGKVHHIDLGKSEPNKDNLGAEGGPKQRPRDRFFMSKPAIMKNPDYDLPFSPNAVNMLVNEKVDQMTLSDSAQGWVNDRRAARVEALKKAVDILEQEIEMAEKGTVTFNVGGVLPEHDWNFAIPDTLDNWWRRANQSDLLLTIHTWLLQRDYLDQKNSGCSINVHKPWQVKIRKPEHAEEVINFGSFEKAEIIAAVDAMKK